MTPEFSLEISSVSKSFGTMRALSDVTLRARPGQVIGLLGANGAGKSTLMNVLGGLIAPDSGEIRINGEPVSIQSPRHSKSLGIAFVHQELNMFDTMSVGENIFIDSFPGSDMAIDRAIIRSRSLELLQELECDLEPDQIVEHLSTGDRQIIEIARALRDDPSIVILDEPTSSLSARERQRILETVKSLKRAGKTIIYISHFMDEIFEVCDDLLVLRGGAVVADESANVVSANEIMTQMLGEYSSGGRFEEPKPKSGPIRLRVQKLEVEDVLHNISFDLHSGEVVGLWGLLGSGRTELIRAMTGLDALNSGSLHYIYEDGTSREIAPNKLHAKTGLVTEDRRGEGVFLPMSVSENIGFPSLRKFLNPIGILRTAGEAKLAADIIERLSIKVSGPDQTVGTLSGGNQQKVAFGRWIETAPPIYLLDEPTRGLDVGAKTEVMRLSLELARRGCAVLIVLSELDELMQVADRYLVLNRGQLVAEMPGSASREELIDGLSLKLEKAPRGENA